MPFFLFLSVSLSPPLLTRDAPSFFRPLSSCANGKLLSHRATSTIQSTSSPLTLTQPTNTWPLNTWRPAAGKNTAPNSLALDAHMHKHTHTHTHTHNHAQAPTLRAPFSRPSTWLSYWLSFWHLLAACAPQSLSRVGARFKNDAEENWSITCANRARPQWKDS